MHKSTKIWLVIAIILIFIGAGVFSAVMAANGWDFRDLSTTDYKTNTYTSFARFQNISINTETADISFVFTESDCSKVVCYEMEKALHTVSFDDGTLTINQNYQRMWYDHLGINFDMPNITVYLPESAYASLRITNTTGDIVIPADLQFDSIIISATTGDIDSNATVTEEINIETTTGDIKMENAHCGDLTITATTGKTQISNVTCNNDLHLNVSTGKMNLTNVNCKNFRTDGTTGDISMNNVIVEKQMLINRTTGDVKFKNCDASNIQIQLNTGDITGNFLTGKIFTAESSTGKITVPENTPGGICVISTYTGDIKIT